MAVVNAYGRRRASDRPANIIAFPGATPVADRAAVDPLPNRHVTFSAFQEEFRANFGGWSQTTWRGLSGVLRALEEEFGDRPLAGIRPRDIDGYLNRRQREGLSKATCNRYLAALKTMFKTARLWEYIEISPTDDLQMSKERSKVPAALDEAQLAQLLAHCPDPLRTIVAVAADTGMRKSELFRLCWADVDLGARTITLRQTKNGHFRVIPMTQRVHDLLSTMGSLGLPDQRVLPSCDFGRTLAKAAERAQVGHVHPHMLRHTFATRLRDRGVPLDRIMELMGHRSYQMVLRYAKARPQQLFEAVGALDTPSPGHGNGLAVEEDQHHVR